jgi:pimeloyl-ACP methyl ester carboxylesterase
MEHLQFETHNNHRLATVFHDGGGKRIVIFCHGFWGSLVGPGRHFVRAARQLADQGVSSLRFDQYGSGNSEGDFKDSSFDDWVATTRIIAQSYIEQGYQVALFSQSMGGASAIVAASQIPELASSVVWVPDPKVNPPNPDPSGYDEAAGQIVQSSYWQEAHDAKAAEKLRQVKSPMYIIQCENDQYVAPDNQAAIASNAQPQHEVIMLKGYGHGNWPYEEALKIVDNSVEFLVKSFEVNPRN